MSDPALPPQSPSSAAIPGSRPVTLFDIIARIESRNNPRAVRFEQAIYEQIKGRVPTAAQESIIDEIVKRHLCSRSTGLMIYCTSWGRVQIMGFNLYGPSCHYNATVFDYLADENMQRFTFALLIANMRITFDLNTLAQDKNSRLQFAKRYNGADSYADLIADSLRAFGFSVSE